MNSEKMKYINILHGIGMRAYTTYLCPISHRTQLLPFQYKSVLSSQMNGKQQQLHDRVQDKFRNTSAGLHSFTPLPFIPDFSQWPSVTGT